MRNLQGMEGMADAATPVHVQIKEDEEDQQNSKTQQQRLCDFCGESIALLYCRADSAKLCFSCDRQVHSTNQLFTKHTRSQLCDSCGSTPASILCSTENFVLCQNCDWERHSLSLPSIHERRPLEGFTGCPSVTELLTVVGFQDLTKKALLCGDELVGSGFGFLGSEGVDDVLSDLMVWDTPSIVTLDDLIVSNTSEHNFQAMGVPPLPKNRKAACGQYKEEILSQLREMAKSEPNFSGGQWPIEPLTQFQSLVPEQDLKPGDVYAGFEHASDLSTVPSYEASAFQWCSDSVDLVANQGFPSKLVGCYVEENCLVPDKDSDIGGSASHVNCVHEGESHHCRVTETLQVLPKVAAWELTSQERDSAISRYKEKKKTRRYDRRVRYESRKIRAESRTRIKGRFTKLDN